MKHHPFSFRFTRKELTIDLELTNKCNLHCRFCPREKTPKTGFMTWQHFERFIERIEESNIPRSITACGLGDPLLHPDIASFVAHASEKNFHFNINTSGSLLTERQSQLLIESGLSEMRFSMTGIGDLYEHYYSLDFNDTLEKIRQFKRIADTYANPVSTKIVIVLTSDTLNMLESIIGFWRREGFRRDQLIFLEEHNRAGSYQGLSNQKFIYPVEQTIKPEHTDIHDAMCPIPFTSCFVGWDGNYYLCALDWEKRVCLGHISEYSISQIMQVKHDYLVHNGSLCKLCSLKPSNYLQDLLSGTESPRQEIGVFLKNTLHHEKLIEKIRQDSTDTIRTNENALENVLGTS